MCLTYEKYTPTIDTVQNNGHTLWPFCGSIFRRRKPGDCRAFVACFKLPPLLPSASCTRSTLCSVRPRFAICCRCFRRNRLCDVRYSRRPLRRCIPRLDPHHLFASSLFRSRWCLLSRCQNSTPSIVNRPEQWPHFVAFCGKYFRSRYFVTIRRRKTSNLRTASTPCAMSA